MAVKNERLWDVLTLFRTLLIYVTGKSDSLHLFTCYNTSEGAAVGVVVVLCWCGEQRAWKGTRLILPVSIQIQWRNNRLGC